MTLNPNSPRLQLTGMLAIALATAIAFAIGQGVGEGLVAGGIVAVFALIVHFGRGRSATLDAAVGIGDERSRHLGLTAAALAGNAMALILPAWWLVTVATGDVDDTLTRVCTVYGVAFMLSAAYVARRG